MRQWLIGALRTLNSGKGGEELMTEKSSVWIDETGWIG